MKKIIIIVGAVAVGAFGWWTISPLFIDKVVQDKLDPEIVALLALPTNTPPDTTGSTTEPKATIGVVAGTPDVSSPAPGVTPTSFVEGPFPIDSTPGHSATGNVRLIRTPTETIVRYENYDGTNGPDLKVYLTNDLEASDFVSLGAAKGNQGNINYTIPDDVDIDEYKYVVTWCEAFGVLFDYAAIN